MSYCFWDSVKYGEILKSGLGVIQGENGYVWKLEYGLLFAFHSNCGRIFSRFLDIQH